MRPLTLLGYWHSAEEPGWPDPAGFVDPEWDATARERVLAHLRAAPIAWAFGGFSWCRFRCEVRLLGSAERSDGRFVWPEGLAHYVERHSVRLPEAFVTHVLSDAPLETATPFRAETPVATEWWAAQRGFRQASSFSTPASRGRFLARTAASEPTASLVSALRRFPAAQALALAELRDRIRSGVAVPLVSDTYELPRPTGLVELEALGVTVFFTEAELQ